jgi:superfamily II DNA or RNA helicase
MFKPRPYQLKAHDMIADCFRRGKTTLLTLATGAGKSKTVISFVKRNLEHFNWLMVVRNRKLVNQLSEDVEFFGIDHHILMNGHGRIEKFDKNVTVASIDTINSRGVYPYLDQPKPTVLIIDEADQATSHYYQILINKFKESGKACILGMTATPYNGLWFFDEYIEPITPVELRDQGYLCDFKYYIPKITLDYKNIEVQRGEFKAGQVEKAMTSDYMINACFQSWLQFGDNRQTLIFCSTKPQAFKVEEHINSLYDKVRCRFIHDGVPDELRDKYIKEFVQGKITFLINLKIITRGVDIPPIGCILDLAPTLSVNLHIQKLGRGSRLNEFYKDCIVIDPVKNLINNLPFYYPRKIDLSEPIIRTKSDVDEFAIRQCTKCFRADMAEAFGSKNICPYCGHRNSPPPKKKMSDYMRKKIQMESASEEQIIQINRINEFKKKLWHFKNIKKMKSEYARKATHEFMIRKYGLDEIMKIKKSLGINQKQEAEYKRKFNYQPLGGTF